MGAAKKTPRRSASLRAYLFVCLGALVALPTLGLGLFQAQRWQSVQEEQADLRASFAARVIAGRIEQMIHSHVKMVEVLAGHVEASRSMHPSALMPLIRVFVTRYRESHGTFVGGPRGRAIAGLVGGRSVQGVDYSHRQYYQKLAKTKTTQISRVIIGKVSRKPMVGIAVPVMNRSGGLRGFATSAFDSSSVQRLTNELLYGLPGLQAAVLDDTGRPLAHPDAAIVRQLIRPRRLWDQTRTPGHIFVTTLADGTEVRGACLQIKAHGLGWWVIVYRPMDQLAQESVLARYQTAVAVALGISVGLLLAALLGLALARPIRDLVNVMRAIGQGDLSARPATVFKWEPREISELKLAITEMIQSRQTHEQDLQAVVAERTAELQDRTRDLIAALEKERSLGELKTQFVATASHEFRTPLTALLATTDLLLLFSNELTGEERQKHLEVIRKEVQDMSVLLDDLLILSQGEAGKWETRPEPTDVCQLCKEAAARLEQMMRRVQSVEVHCEEAAVMAVVDEKLFRQIVVNLLSNAIKYTPANRTVQLNLRVRDSDLVLQVCDQGIGIPAADLVNIFEPFYRAGNVGLRNGTGLGLAIVRMAAELQGGSATIESEEGIGTTIEVRLPLSRTTAAESLQPA